MPDGFKSLLAASGRKKVVVVLGDADPALYMEDYIHQVVGNYSKEFGNGAHRCHFHYFASGTYDHDTILQGVKRDCITLYDLVERSGNDIDQLYQEFSSNIRKRGSGGMNVVIIDEFYMFSVLESDRNCTQLRQFLRKTSSQVEKMFVFGHREAINAAETNVLYDVASAVAVLSLNSIVGDSLQLMSFTCDLLMMKPERRVTHEKTRFQIVKGEIVEITDTWKGSVQTKNQEEVLKNLTTFKLTLEEDERESKNKLYLPYFDAQKTKVDDPDSYDDFEDDDEEV